MQKILSAHSGGTWTIGRKVSAALGLAVVVGFAATVTLQALNMRESLYAEAITDNLHMTELLAIQVSGGMRWSKADAVERAYSEFADDPATSVASLIAFDAGGKPMATYRSKTHTPYDLSQSLALDPDKLAKGETVAKVIGEHLIVAAPVTAGKDKDRVGTLAIAWSLDSLNTKIVSALRVQIIVAVIALLALVAIQGFLLSSIVSRPVRAMTRAMGELADGNLEVEIPGLDRHDEIGEMAGAVQVFKDNAIEKQRMVAEHEAAEQRAEADKRAAMNKVADEFAASVGNVVESLTTASSQMQSTAKAMSSTADTASQQAATVAAAAEQASANVQTVASAAEELSSSISEISRQVAQSSEIAGKAVKDAEHTNSKVQGLAEAANKIGEVVALITDIADQTNLLALNATIEAARAGDAGKGFAVVASEVKNLANQTAKATEEIGAQIGGIQSATQEAVAAIQGISKTISEVDEIAAAIASAVEEQGAATQEIARNVEQAAAGTQEVSSNITGVNQAADETGQVSGQVLEAASALSRQSETLQTEVSKFLAQMKSA